MIGEAVMEALRKIVPEDRIFQQESMEKHTAFRIGGPADVLIELGGVEELRDLQQYLNQEGIPYFLLGNGSNLLVGDGGIRGAVLHMGTAMSKVQVEGNRIIAQAGAFLSQVAREALEHSLTGLEFASGIPGSIGGGVVMNAGAYGGELKQVVTRVTALDEEGRLLDFPKEEMKFGYRYSILKERPLIVTEVELRLQEGDRIQIRETMDDLARRRREKQPLEYPSAGSTFKRPEGHFAGELIMKAGMRGFQVGGARVSDKHCGFVVNMGGATAQDVADVMREARRRVKEAFDVELEPEVILLGEFRQGL